MGRTRIIHAPVTVAIRMESSTLLHLERLARDHGVTRAHVIRDAITHYLEAVGHE